MPNPPLTPAALPLHPFRRAVLRGLAVVLPPLLTIVIFLWVWNTIAVYLLEPLERKAQGVLVWMEAGIRENSPDIPRNAMTATFDGREYRRTADQRFVPVEVYNEVQSHLLEGPMPATADAIYRRYVELRYLQRYIVVPVFLGVFMLVLYLLGKFLAAGVGQFFWARIEHVINRLPLVRSVYSSVKQVTEFMLKQTELKYTRVVAIEYPRPGIWSLGFVMGEGLLDVRFAANEPVISLLVPTSPLSMTGYTMIVRKSEVLDLNLTIDQAFQFIVSCGVVVPAHQLPLLHKDKPPHGAAVAESGDPALSM